MSVRIMSAYCDDVFRAFRMIFDGNPAERVLVLCGRKFPSYGSWVQSPSPAPILNLGALDDGSPEGLKATMLSGMDARPPDPDKVRSAEAAQRFAERAWRSGSQLRVTLSL